MFYRLDNVDQLGYVLVRTKLNRKGSRERTITMIINGLTGKDNISCKEISVIETINWRKEL